MNETARILCAISTKRMYADEFVAALGDESKFPDVFHALNAFEDQGLINTLRDGHNNIISLQLTPLGAERAREAMREVVR